MLLIVSFFYLAYVEQKQHDSGDWWALYFENPKSDNLDFVIENYGNKTNFHWEILADKDPARNATHSVAGGKIKEGDTLIAKGSIWKSGFQVVDGDNKKITISVSSGDEKKEIYKTHE